MLCILLIIINVCQNNIVLFNNSSQVKKVYTQMRGFLTAQSL